MKKRILAIMLVLPLIVAFAAMGFTKLVSLAVPRDPEDIMLEYEQNEAFEFDSFGQTLELKGSVIPEAATVSLTWTSSNEEVATIEGNTLTFVNEGEVTITASVKADNSPSVIKKSFTAMLMLGGTEPKYIKANYIFPSENGDNVIGLYDYSDSLSGDDKVAHSETISFEVLPKKAPQDIVVSGLNEGVEYDDGKLTFTPSAVGEYMLKISSASDEDVFTEMRFVVVDGVNIYSYEDLIRATDKSSDGEAIALRVNLESKANLSRTNSRHFGYASGDPYEYKTFESTYDTDFLKKMGKPTQLKAAIEIKADVYGNGHTVNLHDFAYPTEIDPATNIAIPSLSDVFAGNPLEFVTAGGLSVYGQGNVGFWVHGDGITLNNVVLKNCNNVDNLSNLDYVGTVVEVTGNDVTIKNSTLLNGRTVVRSFSNERLTIDNCILAYAREFIYKQGSNKFVRPKQSGSEQKPWEEAQKDLFDYDNLPEAAKKGDSSATIKDTSFYRSGIFCIGMDTHFAGEYLYKWIGNNQKINDLAATSYKSTLDLVGDVKFYDWKEIKGMDSSTLVSGTLQGNKFSIDISGILTQYDSTHNAGLIKNGKYVHGGIAFFGGGFNLSEIYFNGERVKCCNDYGAGASKGINNDQFVSLNIALNDPIFDTFSTLFSKAAGEGEFSFCVYRNTYTEIGINDSPFK